MTKPKKTPTMHMRRWALMDKAGRTRDTCNALTKTAANVEFSMRRKKTRIVPDGWTIVDRGPVEPKPNKATVTLQVADAPEVKKLLEDGTKTIKAQQETIETLRTQRDQAHMALKVEQDRVKVLEGQKTELLGTISIVRGQGMLMLEKHLTPAGQKMSRGDAAAVAALLAQELCLVSTEVAQGTLTRQDL